MKEQKVTQVMKRESNEILTIVNQMEEKTIGKQDLKIGRIFKFSEYEARK